MSKKTEKNKKIGLGRGIWLLFSLTANIGFVQGFNGFYDKKDGYFIGLNFIWITLIAAAIMYTIAWAYIKLSKHHPTSTGGSQFVSTAFGKFGGVLYTIINSSFVSTIILMLAVTSLRQNLLAIFEAIKENPNDGRDLKEALGGPWFKLIFDSIGIFLILSTALIGLCGLDKFKKIASTIAIIIWIITLIITIFGLYIIISGGTEAIKENQNIQHSKVTIFLFKDVCMVMFLSMSGFEVFINTTKSLKNKNDISLIFTFSNILSTLFFIAYGSIIILSIGAQFNNNPNLQLFINSNYNKIIMWGGTSFVFVGLFLNRVNNLIQNNYFNSNCLEPIADLGVLPLSLANKNKFGAKPELIYLSMCVNLTLGIILLLIPDLVEGITKNQGLIDFKEMSVLGSLMVIIMYSMVLCAAIKHSIKGNIKRKIWELCMWFFSLAFCTTLFVISLVNIFTNIVNPKKPEDDIVQYIILAVIQISYILITIFIAVILYFVFYKKRLKNMTPEERAFVKEFDETVNVICSLDKINEQEEKLNKFNEIHSHR